MTIRLTSLNVPQSHLKSSILIWLLTDETVVLSLGKDRSCMILRSREPTYFSTVPSGEDRKGPIKSCSLEREKGPE